MTTGQALLIIVASIYFVFRRLLRAHSSPPFDRSCPSRAICIRLSTTAPLRRGRVFYCTLRGIATLRRTAVKQATPALASFRVQKTCPHSTRKPQAARGRKNKICCAGNQANPDTESSRQLASFNHRHHRTCMLLSERLDNPPPPAIPLARPPPNRSSVRSLSASSTRLRSRRRRCSAVSPNCNRFSNSAFCVGRASRRFQRDEMSCIFGRVTTAEYIGQRQIQHHHQHLRQCLTRGHKKLHQNVPGPAYLRHYWG